MQMSEESELAALPAPTCRKMLLEINFTELFSAALNSGEGKLPVQDGQILNNDMLVDILFELVPKMLHTKVLYQTQTQSQALAIPAAPTMTLSRQVVSAPAPSRQQQVSRQISEPPVVQAENPTVWSTTEYPWKDEIQLINEEIFQHKEFRPLQPEILNAILAGADVFACLPTGSGKSLFYQLPTLVKSCSPGVTIVVMPLVALISDQRRQFEIYGMSCMTLGTSDSYLQRISRKISELEGKLKPVIFTSPETLDDSKVFEFVKKLERNKQLDRIVFDEAHCILEWGSTFRKAYTQLRKLRSQEFWAPQIVMLTGSASPFQRRTLMKTIKLRDPAVFVLSHDRPNIFFSVVAKKSEDSDLKLILDIATRKYPNKSGIVYCRTKKICDKICTELTNRHCRAEIFTGDLTVREKNDILSRWLTEETQVVVATIAFGMGINKPDCRFVIHYETPSSIENYYQGAGRAGRDGRPSLSLLMFSYGDIRKQDLMMGDDSQGFKKYMQMYLYAMDTGRCRRNMLLSYFQPNAPTNCNYCDNCVLSDYVPPAITGSRPQNTLDNLFAATATLQRIEKLDLVEEAFNLNDKLITMGYSRVPGEGKSKFKKKKKKKADGEDAGDKMPTSLTSVKLCDALTARKISQNNLTVIAETLPRGISGQKQDAVAHFLIASMIRDGLLQTRFVKAKANFGFIALHPTVDVDDVDSAVNPDSYVLHLGYPIEERSVDLVINRKKQRLQKLKQDGQSVPEDEEQEFLMSQLGLVRSVLFKKTVIQGASGGRTEARRGGTIIDETLAVMDEDKHSEGRCFETIEQFMPNEVMKELIKRKPKDFDELRSIKIFPRDLWIHNEAILAVFKPGGFSKFDQDQKLANETFFKNRQVVKGALNMLKEFEAVIDESQIQTMGDGPVRPSHEDKLLVSNDDELSRASDLFRNPETIAANKPKKANKKAGKTQEDPSSRSQSNKPNKPKEPRQPSTKPKTKKAGAKPLPNPSDILNLNFFH